MPDLNPRRFLLLLLGVAWVTIDAAVLSWHAWQMQLESDSRITQPLILGLMFGQFATAAGWLALGDDAWLRRLTVAVVVLLGFPAAIHFSDASFPLSDFLLIGAIQFVCVMLPLWGLRSLGISLRSAATQRGHRWQFTLLEILALTTLVALALAYLRNVSWDSIDVPLGFAFVLIGSTVGAGWTMWPLLFWAPRAWATAGIVGWIVVGGLSAAMFMSAFPLAVLFGALQPIVLAISVGVIRIAGYELGRSRESLAK